MKNKTLISEDVSPVTPDVFRCAVRRLDRTARRSLTVARGICWGLLWLSITACSVDQEGLAPALPTEQVLIGVRFEAPVYNLATAAPYNTVQLRATGYSGTGQVIDAPIEFSVAPTAETKLSVSPSGMLSAIAEGQKLVVVARMAYNGTTRADTAFVYVIAGTPARRPSRIRFELAAQDSAKIASGGWGATNKVSLRREDAFGNTVPAFVVKVWAADSSVLKISQNFELFGDNEKDDYVSFTGDRPATTMMYASAYAYGEWLRDSLELRVGWWLGEVITVQAGFVRGTTTRELFFNKPKIIIGVGGCVRWNNRVSPATEVDVVFDDSSDIGPPSTIVPGCDRHGEGAAAANGGNIAPWKTEFNALGRIIPNSFTRSRTFPKPGIYKYRSTLYGTTGTIVVCDEKNDPTCAPENYQWLYTTQ